MQSTARRLLAPLVALASALGLAGCGEERVEGDADALLNRAFEQSVRSADVRVDAEVDAVGPQGAERSLHVEASGPYVAGEGALPKLDVDITVGLHDAGQTVQSGFLSTGDRAFVEFGGEFYEQPRAEVERADRELRRYGEGGGWLRALGLEPRAWVLEPRSDGNDDVAGVETEHVSGKLAVRTVVGDVGQLIERFSSAVAGADPDAPRPLATTDLDRLAGVAEDPTFDVYVGKEDDVIRRISASVRLVVPERERSHFGGIESARLRLSVELAHVNGAQDVQAPPKARPVADLAKQLGALSGLLGRPGPGGEEPTPPAGAGGRGPGEEGPDPEALRRYSECLDAAQPDDTAALSRCKALLP